ncbi:hypothetical protein V1511DRAFT_491956 [Dipodascopsis uninucleata]
MAETAEIKSAAAAAAPLADDTGKSPTMKDRIIKHMNDDHQVALRDYLTFYKGIVPARRPVQLLDISVSSLKIGYKIIHNKGIDELEATIELNPPMNHLAEARDVLVGMALQASEGLGYATLTPLDEFKPPTLLSLPIIALVSVGIYFVYWNPTYINDPNSVLRTYKVYGIEIVPLLLKIAFWIAIVYHIIEAAVIYIWTGMYRVPSIKRTGWVVCAFFEGFPALQRFRTLMVEKDKKHTNAKETVNKKE